LNTETKQWLIHWKLQGGNYTIPVRLIQTLPAEAFLYHDELGDVTFKGILKDGRFYNGRVAFDRHPCWGTKDLKLSLHAVPLIRGEWYWSLAQFIVEARFLHTDAKFCGLVDMPNSLEYCRQALHLYYSGDLD